MSDLNYLECSSLSASSESSLPLYSAPLYSPPTGAPDKERRKSVAIPKPPSAIAVAVEPTGNSPLIDGNTYLSFLPPPSAQLYSPPTGAPDKKRKKIPKPPSDGNMWVCPVCTFANLIDNILCDICLTPKGNSPPKPRSMSKPKPSKSRSQRSRNRERSRYRPPLTELALNSQQAPSSTSVSARGVAAGGPSPVRMLSVRDVVSQSQVRSKTYNTAGDTRPLTINITITRRRTLKKNS